ncbi:hypothetical protein Fuma_02875 [Fuerstiella marisgermanici]|uniref:Uncharacterized protein n=1 Tax=Fuerstiella marisgermanici TaxID=1891926 RepID=A0A1P8WGS6_9PLAN|nr:hypothetical protein Fuma_02875 [Fuerstiella marisgermanici]
MPRHLAAKRPHSRQRSKDFSVQNGHVPGGAACETGRVREGTDVRQPVVLTEPSGQRGFHPPQLRLQLSQRKTRCLFFNFMDRC